MRESIDLTRLKGLKLAVASSCDLQYFVNSVRKAKVFSEVTYNFEAGTSDDASIEMLLPESSMLSADVIVASIAETSKKLIYPLMNGRTDLDFEAIFTRVEDALRSLFEYLESSSATACFVFKYPLNRLKLDINDRPWVEGSITFWLSRLDAVYVSLLSSGRYSKIDLLDMDDVLPSVGYGSRFFRDEFWGGHPEGPGAELLASDFWERLVSRIDHQGKIKAIALDLDHTLWDGVFLESETPPKLHANRLVALMHHAKKGIPICVVSKNNPEDVDRIKQIIKDSAPGLARVIVGYYVSWNPKSESLRQMADALGIGTNTIAFFDDNSFERGEVAFALPDVRVYTEQEVEVSLRYGEFSFPRLSKDAARRVQSYRENMERASHEVGASGGDLQAYLHSLGFEISFARASQGDIDRVEELVQRTNQQNLLLNRTDRSTLSRYIELGRAFTISLKDRFGDYGTIGAMVYDESEGTVTLKELAISCRALGKGVEECIISFIDRCFPGGRDVRFVAKRTYKNESFFKKFVESGFIYNEDSSEMAMTLSGQREYPAWFKVNEEFN